MAYEYTEWDQQPEPEASSSRGGGPPRKNTGIGILDPLYRQQVGIRGLPLHHFSAELLRW
jgi:hypothetical protein